MGIMVRYLELFSSFIILVFIVKCEGHALSIADRSTSRGCGAAVRMRATGALAGSPVTPTGSTAALLSSLLTSRKAAATPATATAGSQPEIAAIVNAASFTSATVAPGELVAVFTANAPLPFTISALSVPLPTTLDIASIEINGKQLPLLYAGPSTSQANGQINAQLPYGLPPGPTTANLSLTVLNPDQQTHSYVTGPPFTFTVVSAGPGIFAYGTNRAVVQNEDYSLNSVTNPAAAGHDIVVYLTGGGEVDNPVTTGYAAPDPPPLSRILGSYSATIGGQNAPVAFLGLTPEFVGLLQANILVPAGLPAGDHPVIITINNNVSNAPLIATGQIATAQHPRQLIAGG